MYLINLTLILSGGRRRALIFRETQSEVRWLRWLVLSLFLCLFFLFSCYFYFILRCMIYQFYHFYLLSSFSSTLSRSWCFCIFVSLVHKIAERKPVGPLARVALEGKLCTRYNMAEIFPWFSVPVRSKNGTRCDYKLMQTQIKLDRLNQRAPRQETRTRRATRHVYINFNYFLIIFYLFFFIYSFIYSRQQCNLRNF